MTVRHVVAYLFVAWLSFLAGYFLGSYVAARNALQTVRDMARRGQQ
jgi:uncharacterized protein YneF (UPF0154 family)